MHDETTERRRQMEQEALRRAATPIYRKAKNGNALTEFEVGVLVDACAMGAGVPSQFGDVYRGASGWMLPDYAANLLGMDCLPVANEPLTFIDDTWNARIDRALEWDKAHDENQDGLTPHLDAMLRYLESELGRYSDYDAVRNGVPSRIKSIRSTIAKYQSDCARIREYRETAQEARNDTGTYDFPENYQDILDSVPVERVLRYLCAQQTGKRWVCPRCQHKENRRRGTLAVTGHKWYCFHCKEGGAGHTLLQHVGYTKDHSIQTVLEMV